MALGPGICGLMGWCYGAGWMLWLMLGLPARGRGRGAELSSLSHYFPYSGNHYFIGIETISFNSFYAHIKLRKILICFFVKANTTL